MDELIQELEDEKKKRFSRSWTKLDKGSKLSRITIFVDEETVKNELNEDESKKLKKLLVRFCNNGSLNKIDDIEYSIEECRILSIKNLKYNENKTYSFNLPKKVIKTESKSKSNIDRHFSKSKDNKK